MLQLTVSQSVCLGVEPQLGLMVCARPYFIYLKYHCCIIDDVHIIK
jgi:hypothetical protein